MGETDATVRYLMSKLYHASMERLESQNAIMYVITKNKPQLGILFRRSH